MNTATIYTYLLLYIELYLFILFIFFIFPTLKTAVQAVIILINSSFIYYTEYLIVYHMTSETVMRTLRDGNNISSDRGSKYGCILRCDFSQHNQMMK